MNILDTEGAFGLALHSHSSEFFALNFRGVGCSDFCSAEPFYNSLSSRYLGKYIPPQYGTVPTSFSLPMVNKQSRQVEPEPSQQQVIRLIH